MPECRDLIQNRAEIIVDTAPADYAAFSHYPLSRFPTLAEFVMARYEREIVIDKVVIYRRSR